MKAARKVRSRGGSRWQRSQTPAALVAARAAGRGGAGEAGAAVVAEQGAAGIANGAARRENEVGGGIPPALDGRAREARPAGPKEAEHDGTPWGEG